MHAHPRIIPSLKLSKIKVAIYWINFSLKQCKSKTITTSTTKLWKSKTALQKWSPIPFKWSEKTLQVTALINDEHKTLLCSPAMHCSTNPSPVTQVNYCEWTQKLTHAAGNGIVTPHNSAKWPSPSPGMAADHKTYFCESGHSTQVQLSIYKTGV